MKNFQRRILDIVFISEIHCLHFILGISELTWAITLFLQDVAFDRPTYRIMAVIMPTSAWAFLFLVTGSLQLLILLRGLMATKLAAAFSVWNTMLWWYVLIAIYLTGTPAPAGELGMALGAAWLFVRSGIPCAITHYVERGEDATG